MRSRASMAYRFAGLASTGFGLVLSYDFFTEPTRRIGPGGFGGFMLVGPLLVAVGALLAWQPSAGRPAGLSRVTPGSVGAGLVVSLGLAYVAALVSGNDGLRFIVSAATIPVALPALVLALFDIWLRRHQQPDEN